jgi:hypothetical protein
LEESIGRKWRKGNTNGLAPTLRIPVLSTYKMPFVSDPSFEEQPARVSLRDSILEGKGSRFAWK